MSSLNNLRIDFPSVSKNAVGVEVEEEEGIRALDRFLVGVWNRGVDAVFLTAVTGLKSSTACRFLSPE